MKESKKKLALEKLTISKLNSPLTIKGGSGLGGPNATNGVCPTSQPPITCTCPTDPLSGDC